MIDDIQLSRMPLPLAETAKRIEGDPRHFVVERRHDQSRTHSPCNEWRDSIREDAVSSATWNSTSVVSPRTACG
jgi:hypothetical protein